MIRSRHCLCVEQGEAFPKAKSLGFANISQDLHNILKDLGHKLQEPLQVCLRLAKIQPPGSTGIRPNRRHYHKAYHKRAHPGAWLLARRRDTPGRQRQRGHLMVVSQNQIEWLAWVSDNLVVATCWLGFYQALDWDPLSSNTALRAYVSL